MITEREAFAALPPRGFIRDYTLMAMQTTDGNLAYHIPSAAICLAQTTPVMLGFPQGLQRIWTNLYGLVVGQSTDAKKTAAIDTAKWLLLNSEVGTQADEPGSQEHLSDSFATTARQVLLYEEFGDFLSKTMPGSYLHSLRTSFTKVYDGAPMARATVKKKGLGVAQKNPRLSILGGINPTYLEDYTTPNDWMGGFLGRFFTVYAERERTIKRRPTEVPAAAALVDRLKKLKIRCGEFEDLDGKPLPECKGWDGRSERMWDDWVDTTRSSAVGSATEVRSAIARAQAMALKLSMLISWDCGELSESESGQTWWIREGDLGPALAMTDLHVKSVIAIGRKLATNKDVRDKQRVGSIIVDMAPGSGITLGQISAQAKIPGFLRRLKDVLYVLEEEGVAKRVTVGGGKPDRYFPVDAAVDAPGVDLDAGLITDVELATAPMREPAPDDDWASAPSVATDEEPDPLA